MKVGWCHSRHWEGKGAMVKGAWGLTHLAVLLAAGIALGAAIVASDPVRTTMIAVLVIVFLAWANDQRLGRR